MAYIVVTTDTNFIYVEFNDLWDGKRVKEKSMKIRRSQVIEITKRVGDDLSESVRVDIAHHGDPWDCSTVSGVKSWTYPVESVNGVLTDTTDKLFVELEKIM